jgi:superfamily II DNA or RNA helicase
MARRMVWEPAVRQVVRDFLVPLFLRTGSVNALTESLNAVQGGGERIHPNRIHGLLSEDARRGLNDGTLEAVRSAASAAVAAPDAAPERTNGFADQLRAQIVPRAIEADDSNGLIALARDLGVPAAVVRHFLVEAGRPLDGPRPTPPSSPPAGRVAPDWGYQGDAVRRAREALRRSPGRKVGVVIPTGGGKTRVGNRIALEELADAADAADPAARVAWVTHRVELRRQAHADLQRMVSAGGPALPAEAADLWSRIDFLMVGELTGYLADRRPLVVIVDEAHHAPAPSYKPLFDAKYPVRGVFLTATPNRTDGQPLGIDEIAYAITYRELADRGVVLRPTFEPFPVRDFDWESPTLRELAEEVVKRADGDFTKTLVVAPTVGRAEEFYSALVSALAEWGGHVLDPDDLGYVVAGRNSHGLEAGEFLDLFRGKERAILVSAQMLLEGFDDPGINAVVVTYPSSSLVRLMQAAGRCVRYAPGKSAAFVVQARNTDLGYYYDEGWLYQDISDALRPRLVNAEYANVEGLAEQVRAALDAHRVDENVRAAVERRLAEVRPGEEFRLLFAGLPYYGPPGRFESDARWSAVPVGRSEAGLFLTVFNDYCASAVGDPDPRSFLARYVPRSEAPDSDWRLYYTMLAVGMNYARAELAGAPRPAGGRAFRGHGPTTWLAYQTFRHRPQVPPELESFLEPCANRPQALAAYTERPEQWTLAVRLRLPLGGWWAYLLDGPQANWFTTSRRELTTRLAAAAPEEQFAATAGWRASLPAVPVPAPLADRLDTLIPDDEANRHTLPLQGQTKSLA